MPGPIFLAACQSEDGVIFLKPIMDGVEKEEAHSLSLTETGVEHLEAAGPLQGVAIRRCQSRCCKVGGWGCFTSPSKEVSAWHQEERERRYQLGV